MPIQPLPRTDTAELPLRVHHFDRPVRLDERGGLYPGCRPDKDASVPFDNQPRIGTIQSLQEQVVLLENECTRGKGDRQLGRLAEQLTADILLEPVKVRLGGHQDGYQAEKKAKHGTKEL